MKEKMLPGDDPDDPDIFLKWALPRLGYRWQGFRKPRKQVICRIKKRMERLQMQNYAQYAEYLEQHHDEWSRLDALCDITIARFFRDRKLWDFLLQEMVPKLHIQKKSRPLQIWSAGCCNGEEAYSAAMVVRMALQNDAAEILASDRNTDVLQRAERGVYPEGALKELTDDERRQWFEPVGNGEYRIISDIKDMVKFENRDISRSLPDEMFDMVFCRNLVFTYFTRERQETFMAHLKPRLATGGLLVTGAHESPPQCRWLKSVSNTHPVFQK